MSGSPMDVVAGLYDSFAQGDIPAIVSRVAEDIEWRVPENLPHGGDFSGRDGLGRFFQGLGDNWDGIQLEREHLVGAGEMVVAVSTLRGRLRATGEQTGYRSVHVWTVRDGVPVRFHEYVDAPTSLTSAPAVSA